MKTKVLAGQTTMSAYEQSQRAILEAECAQREGNVQRAQALFLEAAKLQGALVAKLPAEKVRTRSVYGLSAATLFYKAGELDEAERVAHSILAHAQTEEYSAAKIRTLIARIWDDRAVR